MRQALLLLAFAALIAGCGPNPAAPEDGGGALQPAEECTTEQGNPC